jgi:hypothetical protein
LITRDRVRVGLTLRGRVRGLELRLTEGLRLGLWLGLGLGLG